MDVTEWAKRGSVFQSQGNFAEAVSSFREALKLKPASFDLKVALASNLRFAGNRKEALQICELLLAMKRGPELLILFGNLLQEEDQFDQAIEILEEALQVSEPSAPRLSCLGIAYFRRGDIDRAMELFEQAIALQPDYADGHFHLGMALLLRGNFDRGWKEYEYRPFGRKRTKQHEGRIWQGQPLSPNQTLLLAAEQGLGDMLQFVRFASRVKSRFGCQILLQAPDKLHRLLSTCSGIDRLLSRDEPLPKTDFFLPLLSLPSCFDWRPGDPPQDFPYLFPEILRVQRWKSFLKSQTTSNLPPRLRIGICWQGDPKYPADRLRSIPLRYFEPLFQLDNVQFISLQQGFGSEQLESVKAKSGIIAVGEELDREGGTFLDTIAIMRHLDLLITSDTSVAHLGGAAGCKTWLALSKIPDWRWTLTENRSVWYPNMELFRQDQANDWVPVFEAMKHRIETLFF
jgi:Flp pilus assembly protein TadD